MSKAGDTSPDCLPVLECSPVWWPGREQQRYDLFGAIRRIPGRSPFDTPRDRVPAMDVEKPNSRAEVHTP